MKHVPKWFHDYLVSNNSIISGSGKSCSSIARHNLSSFCFVAKSDNPKWLFDMTFCVVFIKTVSLFSRSLCSFVSPRYRVWQISLIIRPYCLKRSFLCAIYSSMRLVSGLSAVFYVFIYVHGYVYLVRLKNVIE